MGMMDSPRDQILDMIVRGGWGEKSSGDTEAPTGYFGLVINKKDDLEEINEAFEDEFKELELGVIDWNAIVGNFIVTVSSTGGLTVEQYDTVTEARAAYEKLEDHYVSWRKDEDFEA